MKPQLEGLALERSVVRTPYRVPRTAYPVLDEEMDRFKRSIKMPIVILVVLLSHLGTLSFASRSSAAWRADIRHAKALLGSPRQC